MSTLEGPLVARSVGVHVSEAWHATLRAIQWLSGSKSAMIGAIILAVALLVALIGPSISPHPYDEMNLSAALRPPVWMHGGSWEYPLGADNLGRSVLSRTIYSVRIAFLIGCVVTLMAATVGVSLGLMAGYFGGIFNTIVMRVVDVQWSFPIMILAIAFMSMLGTTLVNLFIVLTISQWVGYARLVRSQVVSLREQEYVTAAVATGVNPIRIIVRHILPNTTSPILVLASFNLASIVLMEASLSFLGLGVQPPTPSLGSLISGARPYIYTAWWLITLPGVVLAVLVLGVNQLGDGLRDLLDPRLKGIL